MPLVDEELLRGQREAEQRVRRMREENRRLAQRMGACPPEERPCAAPRTPDGAAGERLLPLLLALLLYRSDAPRELVLALVYLAL